MALASLFLAGIAIAMAARRFATRHLDHCAVLRTLGATQGFILRVYTLCLLWLGLLTSALGCLVGAGAQFVLARLLTGLVEGDLPAPSWIPFTIGTVTGLTALIGFALPPARNSGTPRLRVCSGAISVPVIPPPTSSTSRPLLELTKDIA
jgi:putative ABC transport system permease protein